MGQSGQKYETLCIYFTIYHYILFLMYNILYEMWIVFWISVIKEILFIYAIYTYMQ